MSNRVSEAFVNYFKNERGNMKLSVNHTRISVERTMLLEELSNAMPTTTAELSNPRIKIPVHLVNLSSGKSCKSIQLGRLYIMYMMDLVQIPVNAGSVTLFSMHRLDILLLVDCDSLKTTYIHIHCIHIHTGLHTHNSSNS